MKVHYINILLFAHALNILVSSPQKNTYITEKIPTTRSLCECELYSPTNYDSDPQMKSVMENFNKQTQQRFHEYDDRMVEKRMQCKDKCEKEIQKIILKDKLEKQMAQHFDTLHTDIQSDAIPTCVCEKSMADKTEKFCLNCGKTMAAVAPGWGLVSGLGYAAWETAATAAAIELATKKGIEEGVKVVIAKIKGSFYGMLEKVQWQNLINVSNYNSVPGLMNVTKAAITSSEKAKTSPNGIINEARDLLSKGESWFTQAVKESTEAAAAKTESVKAIEVGKVTAESTHVYSPIAYSVLAILIIVLIMVIIYLILHYRRKKKMKKKFQYIKLLEE
ncbi:rifin PIR protein, putative [Plasmodium reichenowi]|uniref:Rifin PIR protein, putative n=1 Tax=Plasmodium reichenowi TaxID=5854 RepID=A0A2P9D4B2_PLARE|nr:rifin PIR protein, putative [Plasmodium reichenowi]